MHSLVLTKKWWLSPSLSTLLVKSLFGSALLALLAQVSIPLQPVPITGQTLGVTLVGLGLGLRAGLGAVLLYLLEGAAGLPVFAGGGGSLASFFGATGGYLWGFIPSAALLGWASDRGVLRSGTKTFGVALLASALTFIPGLWQLSYFVPSDRLLDAGLIPFIPGGIIKALVASAVLLPTYNFFKKI